MSTLAPIAIQLYSVREALKEDFAGVVRKLADIGYVGVEPFGTPDNLAEAASLFKELGLEVPSAHVPLPVGEDKAKTLESAAAYGLERIVSGLGPDAFKTLDDIKHSCDLFNEAHRVAAENGLTLGIHNHWWEYLQVNDRYVYEIMLELLDPAIFFQVDVYWVKTAGVDPARVVAKLGEKAPLLHIKDGPAVKDAPQTAVGDGILDIPGIVKAGAGAAEWLIVELDHCATDMMAAVEKSYQYLINEELGRGSKV
jgi:sugar phosphate isomerase/epimerase